MERATTRFVSRCVAGSIMLFAIMVGSPVRIAAETPGTCISSDEATLLTLVNQYRAANQLAAVPWSRCLMTVGQWHAWDAATNTPFTATCNLHSWSTARPDLWVGGCYTDDHANTTLMWFKPDEITGGVYTGYGFENAASGYASAEAALEGWKNSAGHNAVILNEGMWSGHVWRAMGVGADTVNRYYFLWFSTMADPLEAMPLCSTAPIFSDGFESSNTDGWSNAQP